MSGHITRMEKNVDRMQSSWTLPEHGKHALWGKGKRVLTLKIVIQCKHSREYLNSGQSAASQTQFRAEQESGAG